VQAHTLIHGSIHASGDNCVRDGLVRTSQCRIRESLCVMIRFADYLNRGRERQVRITSADPTRSRASAFRISTTASIGIAATIVMRAGVPGSRWLAVHKASGAVLNPLGWLTNARGIRSF
jgi:hypothetical protein